jgi:hypothetical protein
MSLKPVGDIEDYKIVIGREHATGFTWGAYLANPMTVMLLNHDVCPGFYGQILDNSWYSVWHPTYTDPEISYVVAQMIHDRYAELNGDVGEMRPEVKVFYDKIVPRMIMVSEDNSFYPDRHSYVGALKLRYPYTLTVLGEPANGVFPILTLDPRANEEALKDSGNEGLRFLEYYIAGEEKPSTENTVSSAGSLNGDFFPEYVSEFMNPVMERMRAEYVDQDGPLDEDVSDKLFQDASSEIDNVGLEVVHRYIQFVYGKRSEQQAVSSV